MRTHTQTQDSYMCTVSLLVYIMYIHVLCVYIVVVEISHRVIITVVRLPCDSYADGS